METQGWSIGSDAAVAVAVVGRRPHGMATTASWPDCRPPRHQRAVAVVPPWCAAPSTQSGPWNSASSATSSVGSARPASAARYGCHQPLRSETKRRDPSPRQAGWPIDSPGPPATGHGGTRRSQDVVPGRVPVRVRRRRPGAPAERPEEPRRPTACPGGPRPRRPYGRRRDERPAPRRSRARRPPWSHTAPRRASTGRPRCARVDPIPRDGSRGRPAPSRRPPWRSARRGCAPRRRGRRGGQGHRITRGPARRYSHTRWSDWFT